MKNAYRCIYFGNTNRILTYNKQEHIIPASLGGKRKLPKGYVSDEANELFSKSELKATRYTLLSVNRNNNGPGKRGSFSVKKVTSPKINVFEVKEGKSLEAIDVKYVPIRLGFLFCGTIYMIPQILFLINNDWSIQMPRMVTDTVSNNSIRTSEEFLSKLNQIISNENQKYNFVKSDLKRKDKYFIIGMYKEKFYISTSLSEKNTNIFLNILKNKKLSNSIPLLKTTVAQYHYSYEMTDIFDESFPFIYLKTAFNTLAFFFGTEFMLDSQFDEVRKAILNVEGIDKFYNEKNIPKWLIEWVNSQVKTKEHFVVINAENSIIEVYVSFYRERLSGSWILSKSYKGKNLKKYFICNYEKCIERWSE